MNGTNTGFAVPVCEKYIIVLRYKLSVNSRSSFWCFTFAVVSTLRCLTLAVALNNAPSAIFYAKFSVILTRPVAFCRVLIKIRLSSERSSFVRGNEFTFFTEDFHRSLRRRTPSKIVEKAKRTLPNSSEAES